MIEPGAQFAHYRLVEQIGVGGMGVVWRARDPTLNRDVAIKILPAAFADDPDRRARFEREARLLATLNHGGIAAVYGLHEHEGITFIAMEYVPGEDLAEQLKRGPLPLDDALDVARQVAAALETAHEKGVIHRDLKPANIKRTPDGTVKVLDLGLAKALATEASSDPGTLSLSPTVTSAGTVAGTLLGTAAYMSPEQVKGRDADRRADIWAFGVVLFEMLTGRAIFAGETISETLASVLRDEVDQADLPEQTPPGVRQLLKRCLDRDRRTRLQDIGEARIALSPEGLADAVRLQAGAGATETSAAPRRASRLGWAVAALALFALIVVSWLGMRGPDAPFASEVRANVVPPNEYGFLVTGAHAGSLSVSPDGTKMTFVASTGSGRPSLFLRSLRSTEARMLPGTEGGTLPFWSPDSRQIAFFVDGKLKKLPLDGGAPMTVADAGDGRGGTWAADGTILYAPDTQSAIQRVSAGGVRGEPVTAIDTDRGETTHRFPWFLPDQRHFLYVRGSHGFADADPVNSIWIGDTQSDETTLLMGSISQARYTQGHVFWVNEGFLMARAFDPDALEFSGEAFAVGEDVVMQPDTWLASFNVSEAGPIVFQSGLAPEHQLAWFDRDGQQLDTIGDPGRYAHIRLSPDGASLAVTLDESSTGNSDLWIYDLRRNVGSRLTFDDAPDEHPVWSPDGERVAFSSKRDGVNGIFVRAANGRGEAQRIYESELLVEPEDWSSDGKFITFNAQVGRADVWILAVDEGEAQPFVTGNFDEGYARFTPDAKWLSYLSNESGRYELYLTRFPGGEGKWQLSKIGADWLLGWNGDGTEVYYLDLEGRLCTVQVELSDQVVADVPNCLFQTRAGRTWDHTTDGQRFVLGVPEDADSEFPITLILNWEARKP